MISTTDERFDAAIKGLSTRIGGVLSLLPNEVKHQTQEIRLRVNRPVSLCCSRGIYFINENGTPSCRVAAGNLIAEKKDLEESFRYLCGYSVYSHQNEIRNGYLTLCGGHRVGIGGTAVYQQGEVGGMRDISSLNIRVARQIPGAADELVGSLKDRISEGLLIVGEPSSGKTTLLRDLARQISGGHCGRIRKVTVVDERGELAGTSFGVPQNDLGPCCDVLDGFPKAEGILQAVRALSPEVILCDELGSEQEAQAVLQGLNAGVAMVASIHAGSIAELLKRRQALLLLETGAFGSVAFLEGCRRPGKLARIYKAGDLLAQADGRGSLDSGGNARGVCGVA